MKVLTFEKISEIALFTIIFLFISFYISSFELVVEILRNIDTAIKARPINDFYFPIFVLIGLFYPLILISKRNKSTAQIQLLNSYLFLLFGQIASEIICVFAIGKSFAVIVGLVFSVARIFQLSHFLKFYKYRSLSKNFVMIQIILWCLNIFNISANRIIPALHNGY